MSRLLVLPMALALLLVSCGGTDSTQPSAAGDSGDGETLADFLGDGIDWEDADAEAQLRQQERDIQEHIRQCMVEQGFDYIPVEPPDDAFFLGGDDEAEWLQTMGFGITTWVGNEDDETITEVDVDTGEEYQISTGFGSGCSGEAYAEIYGDPEAEGEVWEQLEPAFEQLNTRMEADPRIVEANAEWSTCMAEAGFDYETRNGMHEEIWSELSDRLEEITGPDGGYYDPFEDMTHDEIDAFFEEKTDAEIDAFYDDQRRKSMESIDQEALAALQQEEIDLAVADAECGEDHDDLFREVYEEYERDLVAENRELLEQIRDSRNGS